MPTRSRALGSLVLLAALGAATPGLALPPGETARGFTEGANHHLGDASFVARFDRTPGPQDGEALRMHTHLAYVRAWLAARPATRPELAARRAEILGYLDDYLAAGVTPWNLHLPWRNPVFVDDFGNVCAVGYLIQRSAGRALVDRIAAAHRYDYLEDIAMPEVQAWVAGSGFTLDELASIQPGYVAPMVEQWQTWDLRAHRPVDGPRRVESEGLTTTGAMRDGEMEGAWARTDAAGHVLGAGSFHRGAGAWQSRYASGAVLAEGGFAHSHPEGAWRFFHESGHLAAEGRFARGDRDGAWRFYHDAAEAIPIAVGRFARGGLVGRWQHFDARGARIAESWRATRPAGTPAAFVSNAIRFAPTAGGLEHEVLQGNLDGDLHRLDGLRAGGERLYVNWFSERQVYDAAGHRLTHAGDGWRAAACNWSPRMLRAAARGDLAGLHGLLDATRELACGPEVALPAERAAAIDAMLGALRATRVPSPAFVRALALGNDPPADPDAADPDDPHAEIDTRRADDLTDVLANNMNWYVEWPHVDGRFLQVFATLPDHFPPEADLAAP